jgi:hypothetical protein
MPTEDLQAYQLHLTNTIPTEPLKPISYKHWRTPRGA